MTSAPQPRRESSDSQQPPRRIAVSDLLGGSDLVILIHNGQEYRLRLTRANKLILTK